MDLGPDGVPGTDDDVWKRAVDGNFGPQTIKYFNAAYIPTTDYVLGYHGVDVLSHTAWACWTTTVSSACRSCQSRRRCRC